MIRLTGIQKTYFSKNLQTSVLHNINLEIQKGEFVCLHGKSGSGKTTLLNIIGLLDRFTEGNYFFNSLDVATLSENAKAKLRNKHFGYIFQGFHLIPELNIMENVGVPMGYAGVAKKERHRIAGELLIKVHLEHRLKHKPAQLSGGERQRVAIARALSNDPSVVLADEPTGNLDTQSTNEIMEILHKLNQEGKTIILVTHDENLLSGATKILEITDGKIDQNL